ncbi:hypothetical protein OKW37_000444 [Paraburkholderia sp. MM5482-R2]
MANETMKLAGVFAASPYIPLDIIRTATVRKTPAIGVFDAEIGSLPEKLTFRPEASPLRVTHPVSGTNFMAS